MTIELFAICYNEEYLLPFFLQHYYEHVGVRIFNIYDNQSTDRSLEIINDFRDQYKMYPDKVVNVIEYDSGNQIRDDIYVQIKNTCWKDSKADWVIVCDLDEFVHFSIPVNEALCQVKEKGGNVVKCHGYEMVSDTPPIWYGWYSGVTIIEQIKYGTERIQHCKSLLFKPTVPHLEFYYGAHDIGASGAVVVQLPEIKMLHYKFLSLQYLIDIYKARAPRLSDFNKSTGAGFHYNYSEETITAEYNDFKSRSSKIV